MGGGRWNSKNHSDSKHAPLNNCELRFCPLRTCALKSSSPRSNHPYLCMLRHKTIHQWWDVHSIDIVLRNNKKWFLVVQRWHSDVCALKFCAPPLGSCAWGFCLSLQVLALKFYAPPFPSPLPIGARIFFLGGGQGSFLRWAQKLLLAPIEKKLFPTSQDLLTLWFTLYSQNRSGGSVILDLDLDLGDCAYYQ